jgi:hypothetical protein
MVNKSEKAVQVRQPIGQIAIPEATLKAMQEVIDSCVPATTKAVQTLQDSLIIANGLNSLRDFFQNEDVKKLVLTMQDSTLGFLTDREPMALARQNAKKSPQYQKDPYTYEEIVEALIPPMLEGYRFTGNEINIINGKGMPVKNGKHRKVNDLVKNFTHTVGGPKKDANVAMMRCQAKWIKDGVEQSIGYGDDICVIHVEFGEYDGIDKLVGLAESKLFSRVLTRISGKLVIEGDIAPPGEKNIDGGVIKPTDGSKNIMSENVKPKVTYVDKLTTVVDDQDYKDVIATLIKDKKIKRPDEKQNVLRTKDEKLAKEVFELIEQYKGFEDAEKNTAGK